ncbi:MAG: tail fiber protein [Bacteroidota bacterium]
MEEYLGMIKLFAGGFTPRGWADCNGQLLRISGSDRMFALIGTMYGGDGQNTFALPDLRGRIPVGLGQQPGGDIYAQGKAGGSEKVALAAPNLPKVTPVAKFNVGADNADASTVDADSIIGKPTYMDGRIATNSNLFSKAAVAASSSKAVTVDPIGQDNPAGVDVRQPYIGMRYIINMDGIYPSPS